MATEFSLTNEQISENIEKLKAFMRSHNLDAFYISSTDPYLNEYVPLENCHRFYITGFTGSTANVLVPLNGRVKLYVDGRYHEQVDTEINSEFVEAVKCPMDCGIGKSMLNSIKELKVERLGIEGDRTSKTMEDSFKELTGVVSFDQCELDNVIEFTALPPKKEVALLGRELRGEDTSEKLKSVVESKEAFFITALDSVAWLTNCRGFQLPYQSTFMSKAFAVDNMVYVFVDPDCPVHQDVFDHNELVFLNIEGHHIQERLKSICENLSLDKVYFDSASITASDYRVLESVFGKTTLENRAGGITPAHALKSDEEMVEIRKCFERSNRAIFNSLKWAKETFGANEMYSELDFFNKVGECYKEQGIIDQSFHSIAAFKENGSVIHFGASSPDKMVEEGELILLDSGGLYESGFSTDTTRTIVPGGAPRKQLKEIYTYVLKGLLQVNNAVFPEGTTGVGLDFMARSGMLRAGYNYAHGTGHGVGINVHEGGAGISSGFNKPLKPGHLVSIEPGIYLPGIGGVRLEDVGLVKKHPEFEGMLCFENLVWIAHDPALIEHDLLTHEEKAWLEAYQEECSNRGNSF